MSASRDLRYAARHGNGGSVLDRAKRTMWFMAGRDPEVRSPDVAAPPSGLRMRKYQRLLAYAAPHRRVFAVIALLTVFSSALAALQPWPVKLLVDHVLGSAAFPPPIQSLFRTMGWNKTIN